MSYWITMLLTNAHVISQYIPIKLFFNVLYKLVYVGTKKYRLWSLKRKISKLYIDDTECRQPNHSINCLSTNITCRPLGALNYMRIWHDMSGHGKFGGWYLKHILVNDLQTREKYYFISDRWFAVEEDDGQVDRLLPVATKETLSEFSQLFQQSTRKNMSDGHLWFSVVARPAQSRFTRLQRVASCLCLLTTSMLVNAMYYERVPDDSTSAFKVGPLAFTPEQVWSWDMYVMWQVGFDKKKFV